MEGSSTSNGFSSCYFVYSKLEQTQRTFTCLTCHCVHTCTARQLVCLVKVCTKRSWILFNYPRSGVVRTGGCQPAQDSKNELVFLQNCQLVRLVLGLGRLSTFSLSGLQARQTRQMLFPEDIRSLVTSWAARGRSPALWELVCGLTTKAVDPNALRFEKLVQLLALHRDF